MTLPATSINTILRQDYLPEMPNLWAKKDYAMLAKFFQNMEGFESNRIKVDVDYRSLSVATHVGNTDNVTAAETEWATQGEQLAYLFLDTIRFNHTELLNMNTKADVRRNMSRKMDNVLQGMRENFVTHEVTRSASSSQWIRLYDMIDNYTGALHGITPSDLPTAASWYAQQINAGALGGTTRAALMNEGEKSYLPSMIRRLISKCSRFGDKSDSVVYVQSYHWDLLQDIIDSKKLGSLTRDKDAYLGIDTIMCSGVPIMEDPWLSLTQTTANDCQIYLINHKHIKMRANRKAMFTMVGEMIPAQNNTAKVSQIGLYGNFTDEKRSSSGFLHTLYGELSYN